MESILIRVQGLKGVGAGERPGSVWDVDPSLKGPPAVARLVLVIWVFFAKKKNQIWITQELEF